MVKMGGRSHELEVSSDMDDAGIARIEGKINLINERHERYVEDMTDVKTRLNGHSDRLNKIETWKHRADGMTSAVRLMWVVGGAALGTIVTIIISVVSYQANTGG